MDIKFKVLYLDSVVARCNHVVLVQNSFSQAPLKHLTTIITCKLNFLQIFFQKKHFPCLSGKQECIYSFNIEKKKHQLKPKQKI